MNQRQTLLTASVLGALAVALGAFGAHALKNLLQANGRVETFELAVRYHFYHTFALLAVGLFMDKFQSKQLKLSALFFLLGILFFSGSLYLYALTATTTFAMITPIGGVCFLAGWLLLFFAFLKK